MDTFIKAAEEVAQRAHPSNSHTADWVVRYARDLFASAPPNVKAPDYAGQKLGPAIDRIFSIENAADILPELEATTEPYAKSLAYRYLASRLALDGKFEEAVQTVRDLPFGQLKVAAFIDIARYQLAQGHSPDALETLRKAAKAVDLPSGTQRDPDIGSMSLGIYGAGGRAVCHTQIAKLHRAARNDEGARQSIMAALTALEQYTPSGP